MIRKTIVALLCAALLSGCVIFERKHNFYREYITIG